MAAIKFIVFAAVVACAFAAEADERVKKDVLLGTYPYGYAALPHAYSYGYDDGKYYPGKYEKSYVAPAAYNLPVSAYSALPAVSAYSALPAVSGVHSYGAYPYSYGAYPYNYGAYPYSYGAYKPIVY